MQQALFETPAVTRPCTAIRHPRIDVVSIQLIREKSIRYDAPEPQRLTQPQEVARLFRSFVGLPDRELFVALLLDGKNRITSIHQISQGSLNQSIVHPREVFKAAILANAAAIILCHNHPTGDPSPSKEDIDITRRLKDAGEILGIKILDHVIIDVESDAYLSFVASGLI